MTERNDSQRYSRIGPLFALLAGCAVVLTGAVLIYAYVMEAVVARLGEPDQSLLFWYFPFLVCGLGFAAGGTALIVASARRLRGPRRDKA